MQTQKTKLKKRTVAFHKYCLETKRHQGKKASGRFIS